MRSSTDCGYWGAYYLAEGCISRGLTTGARGCLVGSKERYANSSTEILVKGSESHRAGGNEVA